MLQAWRGLLQAEGEGLLLRSGQAVLQAQGDLLRQEVTLRGLVPSRLPGGGLFLG